MLGRWGTPGMIANSTTFRTSCISLGHCTTASDTFECRQALRLSTITVNGKFNRNLAPLDWEPRRLSPDVASLVRYYNYYGSTKYDTHLVFLGVPPQPLIMLPRLIIVVRHASQVCTNCYMGVGARPFDKAAVQFFFRLLLHAKRSTTR